MYHSHYIAQMIFMYARIKLLYQKYLFQYFLEQTANMTLQKPSVVQEQK